jgi:hypothetical protein
MNKFFHFLRFRGKDVYIIFIYLSMYFSEYILHTFKFLTSTLTCMPATIINVDNYASEVLFNIVLTATHKFYMEI